MSRKCLGLEHCVLLPEGEGTESDADLRLRTCVTASQVKLLLQSWVRVSRAGDCVANILKYMSALLADLAPVDRKRVWCVKERPGVGRVS